MFGREPARPARLPGRRRSRRHGRRGRRRDSVCRQHAERHYPRSACAGARAAPAAPQGPKYLQFPGKNDKLVVLGDRPLVAETPEHCSTTTPRRPTSSSSATTADAGGARTPDTWKIAIDGEVNGKLEMTLGELKQKFPPVTRRLVLECGGNGRSFFSPPARGNQWTNGGAGCAEWTGVRLADVLKAAGVKSSAVFTGHYGADPPRRHDQGGAVARRSDQEGDGREQPDRLGDEWRAVAADPRRPGAAGDRRLARLGLGEVADPGVGARQGRMTARGWAGTSYRVAVGPMVPGDKADEKNFRDLEAMPVRSIITSPATGPRARPGARELALRGAAWAGDGRVKRVDVSVDFGATWLGRQGGASRATPTTGSAGPPRSSCRATATTRSGPAATKSNDVMQPHIAGNWNPQGYGGNPMHRIAVLVGRAATARLVMLILAVALADAGHRHAAVARPIAAARLHAGRRNPGGISRRAPDAMKRSMPASPATTSSWWRRRE